MPRITFTGIYSCPSLCGDPARNPSNRTRACQEPGLPQASARTPAHPPPPARPGNDQHRRDGHAAGGRADAAVTGTGNRRVLDSGGLPRPTRWGQMCTGRTGRSPGLGVPVSCAASRLRPRTAVSFLPQAAVNTVMRENTPAAARRGDPATHVAPFYRGSAWQVRPGCLCGA